MIDTIKKIALSIFSRSAFRELGWYTIAQIVNNILSFGSIIFVSRYLGPINLGLYSFVQIYLAAFISVLSSLDIYHNWRIVNSGSPYKEVVTYVFQKSLLTFLVLFLIGSVSFFILPVDVFELIIIMFIPVIFSTLSSILFLAQYEKKAKLVSLSMIVSSVCLFIFKLVSVYTNMPLKVFVFINSLDGILLYVLVTWYFFKRKSFKKELLSNFDFRLKSYVGLFKTSLYSFVYTAFWYVVLRADQFVVPFLFGAYSLGVYSAAVKVSEIANVIIVVLQGVIISRLNSLDNVNNNLTHTKKVTAFYFLLGLLVAIFLSIFAAPVIKIIFGGKFLESIAVLRVYAWSIPGLFVTYFFTTIFMSKQDVKSMAYHAIFFACVTVPVLFYLTNQFGILGTAFASVLVYNASAVAYYLIWFLKYKK